MRFLKRFWRYARYALLALVALVAGAAVVLTLTQAGRGGLDFSSVVKLVVED